MVILYLNEKKILHAIKRACNYQGENAFETLRIISANTISGHALNDCIVECHIINPNGEGDIVQLNFNDTTPDGEPTCDILLGNKYTAVNGELTVFLKLFCDNDVIGLTNEVTIKIREHQAVTSYIPESQLTLLDQYSQTFHEAERIIENGVDEEKVEGYIVEYLDTHEIVDELTAAEVAEIFEEE